MNNSESEKQNQKPELAPKAKKPQQGFGVLGKELSSRFSANRGHVRRPAVYGGRNGNGKPT